MGINQVLDDVIEEKLLNVHTAFIGRVVGVQRPDLCSVQPIDKIKAYGKKARSQSVITNVPILNHVRRYTLVKQTLKAECDKGCEIKIDPEIHPKPEEINIGHLKVEPLKPGDLVLCVCAERDITSSVKGFSTTPPVGHHQIGNAVVVGWFELWPHEK